MKKINHLLFIIALLFSFVFVVNATDKYELKEVELSEKNVIYEIIKLNKTKDGFLAVGELYEIKKPEDQSNSLLMVSGDVYGNVYNISFDGKITKANLFYENNAFDYIYESNSILTHTKSGSVGFYDPIYTKPLVTNEEGPVDGIDETFNIIRMGCPHRYMINNDYQNAVYDFLGATSTDNFICSIAAENEDNELTYGLVMQGPGSKIVLEPSNEFEIADIFDDKIILKKKNDNGYAIASSDGIVGEFDNWLLEKIQDTYDEAISIDPLDINVVSYNNKLIYQIPVRIVSQNITEIVYVYNNNIIGTYSAQSSAIKTSSGYVFIEDLLANKLYNLDGSILADEVNTYGYCYTGNCNLITFVKGETINFFDGKNVIYQMNYNDKYEYLFSYQLSYEKNHVFLSGEITPEGYRSSMSILTNMGPEVKEEPKEEVQEKIKYEVLAGNNQTYDTKGKSLLEFRFSIPFSDFKASGKVYLDDELVDSKNYDIKEGSTIITFKQSFSKEIKDGNHTVKVVTDLGEVVANFKSIGNPATLDKIVTMATLLGISLAGVYVTCVKIKKHN